MILLKNIQLDGAPVNLFIEGQRIHRILNLKHLQDSLQDEVDRKTSELLDSNQRLKALSDQIIHALTSAVDTDVDVFSLVCDTSEAFGNFLRIRGGAIVQSLNLGFRMPLEEEPSSAAERPILGTNFGDKILGILGTDPPIGRKIKGLTGSCLIGIW